MGLSEFNLAQCIDPTRLIFYFKLGEIVKNVHIRRMQASSFFVDVHDEMKHMDRFFGYVVLKDNRGIAQFECQLSYQKIVEDKVDVVELAIDTATIQTLNRREFYRIDILQKYQANLLISENNSVPIGIVDLSAGGLAFEILEKSASIHVGEKYLIHIPELDRSFGDDYLFPITTIRDGGDDVSDNQCWGGMFVIDKTMNSQTSFSTHSQEQIIQFVNDELRIRRKKIRELKQDIA